MTYYLRGFFKKNSSWDVKYCNH
eukprot:UN16834